LESAEESSEERLVLGYWVKRKQILVLRKKLIVSAIIKWKSYYANRLL